MLDTARNKFPSPFVLCRGTIYCTRKAVELPVVLRPSTSCLLMITAILSMALSKYDSSCIFFCKSFIRTDTTERSIEFFGTDIVYSEKAFTI